MSDFAKRVGERIRMLRLSKHYKLRELSRECGISPQRLKKYETGFCIPQNECAVRIAKALRVPPEALFGDSKMRLVRSEITPRAALAALANAVRRLPMLETIPLDLLDELQRIGAVAARQKLGLPDPAETLQAGNFCVGAVEKN